MSGPIPFVPGTYDYRPGERIADLILKQGDIQAQRQARSGEIIGGMVNQLGQAAGQGIKDFQQAKDQQAVGKAVSDATSTSADSPAGPIPPMDANGVSQILAKVDPRLRPQVMKGIQDFQSAADVADERKARIAKSQQDLIDSQKASQQADTDAAGVLAHHALKLKQFDGPDGGLGAATVVVGLLKDRKITGADALDQQLQQATQAMQQAQASGDPGQIKAVGDQVRKTFMPIAQNLEGRMSEATRERISKSEAPIKGSPGDTFLDPSTMQPVASVPEKAAKVGTFEDYVTRKFGPQPTPQQIEGARKTWAEDGHVTVNLSAGQTDDVKQTVAGMRAGHLPPLLPGRASKEYVALMAEAERQHFDLAGAATDWTATQKHIASMNSSSQLKLNQSINALPEMLDKVDALAAQFKGGRFPILNKANLAAAKAGAYGSDVAVVANQLSAQIADVTADLGNVYMGGNSPTDHALDLAAKSLSADWDEKVLHKMTDLARSNVQIRQNSIRNTGVAGASEGNPYGNQPPPAPAAPAAPVGGTISVKAPNGKIYTFQSQADADAFKKRAGL